MTDILEMLENWLFKGWESIGRVFVVGVLAYAGLLVFLRVSGKRSLSKMNAFDLVVTVALGSTLSTIIVSRQTGVADGLTALGLLIALQYAVARQSTRWSWFKKWVKSEPSLLFYRGQFLKQAMRRQRVVEGEILSAIRQAKIGHLSQVEAVVLEADGSFSVVKMSEASGPSSLEDLPTHIDP